MKIQQSNSIVIEKKVPTKVLEFKYPISYQNKLIFDLK